MTKIYKLLSTVLKMCIVLPLIMKILNIEECETEYCH